MELCIDRIGLLKISDFGLVKRPDSSLTSRDSVVNGTWLDPLLDCKTFGEYDMTNEILCSYEVGLFRDDR